MTGTPCIRKLSRHRYTILPSNVKSMCQEFMSNLNSHGNINIIFPMRCPLAQYWVTFFDYAHVCTVEVANAWDNCKTEGRQKESRRSPRISVSTAPIWGNRNWSADTNASLSCNHSKQTCVRTRLPRLPMLASFAH